MGQLLEKDVCICLQHENFKPGFPVTGLRYIYQYSKYWMIFRIVKRIRHKPIKLEAQVRLLLLDPIKMVMEQIL